MMRMKVRASDLREGDRVVLRQSRSERLYRITSVYSTNVEGVMKVVSEIVSDMPSLEPTVGYSLPSDWVEVERAIKPSDVDIVEEP